MSAAANTIPDEKRAVFTVHQEPELFSTSQEIDSIFDHLDLITNLTEDVDLYNDIVGLFSEALGKAKNSKDPAIIEKTYDRIIDFYIKKRKYYIAGLKAIEGGQVDLAKNIIITLIKKEEPQKALTLAALIDEETNQHYKNLILELNQKKEASSIREFLIDNRFGLVYLTGLPDNLQPTIYYIRNDNSLGRSYPIMPGFKYIGICDWNKAQQLLLQSKQQHGEGSEAIKQLYEIHTIKPFHEETPFDELHQQINGLNSLVAVNHVKQALIVTEPIRKCLPNKDGAAKSGKGGKALVGKLRQVFKMGRRT